LQLPARRGRYRPTNVDSPVSTFFLGDFFSITSATCNFPLRINVDVVEGKSPGKIMTPEDNTSDFLRVSIENVPDPSTTIEIFTPHPLRGKTTGKTCLIFGVEISTCTALWPMRLRTQVQPTSRDYISTSLLAIPAGQVLFSA